MSEPWLVTLTLPDFAPDEVGRIVEITMSMPATPVSVPASGDADALGHSIAAQIVASLPAVLQHKLPVRAGEDWQQASADRARYVTEVIEARVASHYADAIRTAWSKT